MPNSCAGLATRGHVYKTVRRNGKEYTGGKNHINDQEYFRGYLKRKLKAEGGIRRKHLCPS
ncbi:hypothetical protein KBI33_03220 [Candidatus Shapirobacteria bacterium]|nr:hypothetical protein [Candidatus Shapirobacteria bacterium]